MKFLVLHILLIAFCQVSFTQNWQLLGEDEIGDCPDTDVPDFSAGYYAVDELNDSLFFMFVFDISSSSIEGDFGIALGVDTNLITSDGIIWGGSNQSIKVDLGFIFARNGTFQTEIVNAGSNPITAVIKESDTHDTLVLRFPLSLFDADGRFNFVVGTWSWGIGIDGFCEEMPNEGFFSIDSTSPIFEIGYRKAPIKVYPNPASQIVWIESQGLKIKKLSLFDQSGKVVCFSNGNYLSLPGLQNGTYLIAIDADQLSYPVIKEVIILNHE